MNLIGANGNGGDRIDPELNGKRLLVQTANGVVTGYNIKLEQVNVGSIALRQVDAVILSGSNMNEVLLGVSFLNRLDVNYKAGVMTMESR